jgi:hypothetical protein
MQPPRPFLYHCPSIHLLESKYMENRLDTAAEAQAANEKQLAQVQAVITPELGARPESVDRNVALARPAVVRSTLMELRAELEAYGACDPVKVEEKRRAVVLAREAALHHTGKKDNATRSFPFVPHLPHREADEDDIQLLDIDVPFHSAA